jgi:hypothetical protein
VAAPTNTVKGVQTTDATPNAPTYKISAQPTEDTALATITVDTGGTPPLRPGAGVRPGGGVRPTDPGFDVGAALVGDAEPDMIPYVGSVRLTTSNVRSGRRIGGLGAVCGLDRVGAEGVMPLRAEVKRAWNRNPQPGALGSRLGVMRLQFAYSRVVKDIVATVKYAEVAAPDGNVTVEPEGWV